MRSQLLSQDEVDALLQAPGGVEQAVSANEQALRARWPAQLPALERINQSFAHHLREALPALLRHAPAVTVDAFEVQRFSVFMSQVAAPTNFNVVAFKPLRGNGLIVCDPILVFAMVDALFGGQGKHQAPQLERDFSPTEQRVISRLVALVLSQYAKAWSPLLALEPSVQRTEMLPQFATIAAGSDLVVSSRFTLQLGEATGTLSVCLPCAVLEPVRPQLLQTGKPGESAADPNWTALLKQEIQAAEVDLVAELAQAWATVQQLMSFKPGDFIELDMHPQVLAKVNGVPLLGGHYGISNKRYAIKVEQMMQHAGTYGPTEKLTENQHGL
jgi:flagellar motor switch protein FliM